MAAGRIADEVAERIYQWDGSYMGRQASFISKAKNKPELRSQFGFRAKDMKLVKCVYASSPLFQLGMRLQSEVAWRCDEAGWRVTPISTFKACLRPL